MAKIYNKLVRDHIPEIIESDGRKCTTEILSDDRWLQMLDAKLTEEPGAGAGSSWNRCGRKKPPGGAALRKKFC